MIDERTQILLPRAIRDDATNTVRVRPYPLTVHVRRQNAFVLTMLRQLTWQPPWATVALSVARGDGIVQATWSGDAGSIETNWRVTTENPETFYLTNQTPDAEVLVDLHFRSWQYGEG